MYSAPLLKNKLGDNSLPDSPDQIKFTTDSIYYIYDFCKENNIKLQDYLSHQTGNINSFLLHVKENRINMYSLFGFKNLDKIITSADAEIVDFMMPNFHSRLDSFRTKYYNSEKMKDVLSEGYVFVKNALSG